jgi:hypothetical protein
MDFTIDAYEVSISNVPMDVLTYITYSYKRTLQAVQTDSLPTLHTIFNIMTTFITSSFVYLTAIYKHRVS